MIQHTLQIMNRKRRTAARNCNVLMQLNIIQGDSQNDLNSDISQSDNEAELI